MPFGKVLQGMDVVSTISAVSGTWALQILRAQTTLPLHCQVPTFRPATPNQGALNMLAGQLGDGRAAGVRRKYGRPFKAVVILATGELPMEG